MPIILSQAINKETGDWHCPQAESETTNASSVMPLTLCQYTDE